MSSKTNNKETGNFGETVATDYLVTHKYKIIDRNLNLGLGEIDILAQDQKTIVIVEVKTVKSENFGPAKGYVNYRKQQKLKLLGLLIAKNYPFFKIRIDVIGINLSNPASPIIEHIENAVCD